MRALLIMSHGSPRSEANEVVTRLAGVLESGTGHELVRVGYLDVNEPTILQAIDQCIAAGASEIIAVPYFLHSGKHVVRDLPDLLEVAQARHPGVRILMTDYVGRDPLIDSVLLARVNEAADS